MKILVTGFGPFGKFKVNPTGIAARELDGATVGRVRVEGRSLDTQYRRCERQLREAFREVKPRAAVLFGIAVRPRLAVEWVALNVDHARLPDGAGERRTRRRIDPRGPWVLESTLPVDRILAGLKRARIPADVSFHAGTYVCNHAFYAARRTAPRLPLGFVHIPAGWRPARIRRAARVIVDSIAKSLKRP